jgi:hypothetical protein
MFSDGWGLNGDKGEFYNDNNVIAVASKTFVNNQRVGVLLNMNDFTLDFFIDDEKVLSYCNPNWKVIIGNNINNSKGQIVYPAASLIGEGEQMTINFDVWPPNK